MANIKHVRPKRRSGAQERSIDDIGRAARARLQVAQPPVELTALSITDPRAQAAAFPSLPTDRPAAGPVESPNDHGLVRRVEAIKKCNQAGMERSERAVDAMYACKRFPENLDAQQREWYADLQQRWLPGEDLVEDIKFASLYPSLRATILEQMYNAFPKGEWYDGYAPVRHLCQITSAEFDKIVEENARVWETQDEIPAHLDRTKQQNPGKPIDPDTPPQTGVVHAMRWLKQMHLPGSLLGDWQFPLPNVEAFIVPFELAVGDVGSITSIDIAPSSVPCDGNTTDVDEADDFEISLTESYLHRIVHTRPHTHTTKKPDLLLPPSLECYAYSKGIIRSEPPVLVNDDPLIVFPALSIPGPSSHGNKAAQAHPGLKHTSLLHPETHPQPSSSDSCVAMHADRLWHEHRFNHLDLTIEPDYLSTKPTNEFEALIQLELITLWTNGLAKHLMKLEMRCVGVAFTKEFRSMQEMVEGLRRRILQMGQAVEVFKAGGNVDFEAIKKQATQLAKNPKHKSGTQQQVSKQGASKPYTWGRSKEPNCGFGASTRIIRFQKEGEAASERAGEKGESVEGARPGVQEDVVQQTPKKSAEVIDLEAPQGPMPVPQGKKRPAEVIELDGEGDEVTRTKKLKTSAPGDGEGKLGMAL